MKITLVQNNIKWADKKANLHYVEHLLSSLAGVTDLVVLPEMFTTGFCVKNLELAENSDGETVLTLQTWAKKYNVALTGSFLATENDKYFNRAFFVYPSGEITIADKRHLFTMAKEDKYITAGNKRLIVHYKGFNIFILVCYDVRFPVWSRNINNEYDLLVYVANFPEKRIADWDVLLRARAIENQAYVCGVNRVGEDANGFEHSGHSVLLDFKGNELLSYADSQEASETIEIDTTALNRYRQSFAVWRDADKFSIGE